MAIGNTAFEKAMKLAVVTGLKVTLGPAFLAASQNRPERRNLAMAAIGEMVVDKLPLVPSRSRLPLLIPRALAGYWVAKTSLEQDGVDEPWGAPMGAAVAAGVATIAPLIRGTLQHGLGVSNVVLGLAEDYLALKLGADAVGFSMQEVQSIGRSAVEEIGGHLGEVKDQVMDQARHLMPEHQLA